MNQSLSVEQIMAWKGQINKDSSLAIVQDAQGNRYGVKSKTEYVSGFFSQLENGEVLLPANQPLNGVRSIKGNQLIEGKYQVVTDIRVSLDTTQALETTAALITLPFASTAPVTFKNGEVKISQGADLFASTGVDVSTFKTDDFRAVLPFVIRGATDFAINIKIAGANTAGHAYKVEYRCVEFLLVGKS